MCALRTSLKMKLFFATVIWLFNIIIQGSLAYVPPTPSVEPLYPKGLRMSIPDDDGITLVAYHVKFNEDFNGLEAGTIARDIVRVRNGHWTYEDRSTRLKRGDIIYYWIHVVYDGLGYNLLDQQYTVNDFYNYDGTRVGDTVISGISCATPSETKIYDYNAINQQLIRKNVCPGQLLFEDNFDILNSSHWSVVERFSDSPNYEFVVYMNDQGNVEVKDGTLHVKPLLTNEKYGQQFVRKGNITLERCTGKIDTTECKRPAYGSYILPPVISGRLNTKSSFTFLYGRVQIRAKLPRGDWIYPLITLEYAEKTAENSSVYCEIIVAHSVGNPSLKTDTGNDLSGCILQGGGHAINLVEPVQDNKLDLPKKTSSQLWSNDYHVYDLVWRRGKVTVKVDGEQYGEQNVPSLYDSPAYLNIGLGVGGHTVFPDSIVSGNYVKPWRNVASKALFLFYQAENNWRESWTNSDTGLHIDYVKVWAI